MGAVGNRLEVAPTPVPPWCRQRLLMHFDVIVQHNDRTGGDVGQRRCLHGLAQPSVCCRPTSNARFKLRRTNRDLHRAAVRLRSYALNI